MNQTIKSPFWRSNFLIAVAGGSTGHIAVTTPCVCVKRLVWVPSREQGSGTLNITDFNQCSSRPTGTLGRENHVQALPTHSVNHTLQRLWTNTVYLWLTPTLLVHICWQCRTSPWCEVYPGSLAKGLAPAQTIKRLLISSNVFMISWTYQFVSR